MEGLENTTVAPSSTVFMWVAVSIAAIFVLVVFYDAYGRRRSRANTGVRARRAAAEREHAPGFFKRMRRLFRSVTQEASRRRRLAARNQEWQQEFNRRSSPAKKSHLKP